ncbi:Glycoside hydrolase and Glycosyl hydrolases 38 domain containing protein [Aphelenchoides bicaudatus]|nr:Glycoside hydrolase and Glycosyl hydrolases 38 domain containing protein [Aphelenchoides bicaudatus]
MVLAVIKIRRVFVALLTIGFFLFFLNVLGPLLFLGPSRKNIQQHQWFEVESREMSKSGSSWLWSNTETSAKNWTCPARSAHSDVQMLNLYDQLPFDNVDGGVWTQGFPIEYDPIKIQNEKRLEVVVVPHSHCDPGWGWTFEEYYDMRTQHILNGMLKHLPNKTDMKFIYAEMSFFELWWSKINEDQKEKTRGFLRSGQLEIVTGGWVMTDEANARSFSIVMEMIEGHEFLMNQLQYRPKSHWSIDPFGLSPTLAQVVKSSNLTQMALQRVHYSVKKHLAKEKQLEFRWRQMYARDKETDIRAHMMPFLGYAASLTCGPDPQVCCQFDFEKLQGHCEYGKQPEQINPKNVAARAKLLADQYRKKAQLYRMNTILVPLGDDFRYMSEREWEDQYKNYKQLFEHMNNKKELVSGTLQDYFSLLDKRLSEETEEERKDLPILSGDFFTYADRDDHYWSGYYTSRPFYKHMDRTVQHYVRSADILFALAQWKAKESGKQFKFGNLLYDTLVQSRRSLSLFQHHDGITGTSRDYVVLDYGQKMLNAINDSSQIIVHATAFLLNIQIKKEETLKEDVEYFVEELPKQQKVELGSHIILHNSLANERREVVCVVVKSERAHIQHQTLKPKQQIQPRIDIVKGDFVVEKGVYDLCFESQLPALGFERYKLVDGEGTEHMAKLEISDNFDKALLTGSKTIASSEIVTLSNPFLSAKFDASSGYLKSIKYDKENELDVKLQFLHYGARRNHNSRITGPDSMSGPYLFLPDGPATPLDTTNNTFVVIKGDVRQSLLLRGPDDARIYHHIYLDLNSRSLDIVNRVHVQSNSNFELSMRIQSEQFKTTDEQFYTDLNGFQRFEKLPIQAHFYPLTTAGFIDSDGKRLTLLARQSLGAASLYPGTIESILDRRLMQDDNRGIGQGVSDNKHTESHFRLLIESRQKASKIDEQNRAGFLSALSIQSSHSLNYPVVTLYGKFEVETNTPTKWTALKRPFPCDLHLFALRTISEPTAYGAKSQRSTRPRDQASMILERQGVECLVNSKVNGCEETSKEQIQLSDYFVFKAKSLKSTTLTGMYEETKHLTQIQMNPMDLKAIKVEF